MKVTIPEQHLQTSLNSILPIKNDKGLVIIELQKTDVWLKGDTHKIELASDVTIRSFGHEESGKLHVAATPIYDPQTGCVYVTDIEVLGLKVRGIPRKYVRKINKLASKLLTKALQNQPIYQLSNESGLESLAKASLTSLTVEEGELVLNFGGEPLH
jgi:hypothetical protein